MKISKIFFFVLIVFFLIFGIFYYKNFAVRKLILQTLDQKFPAAEISVDKVSYEVPDELHIKKMNWKDKKKYFSFNADEMKFEFIPSNLFSYIKNNEVENILDEFYLKFSELRYEDIVFSSADIECALSKPDMVYYGDIYSEKVKYKKISFMDMMSKFDYSDNTLALNIKSATFAGGRIHGSITIDLRGLNMSYRGDLFLNDLGSSELMVIFGMNEKMDMTGKWNGEVHFSGTLDKIENITGFLSADERGGELYIKDNAMIDKIASKVQVAKDQITESLAHHDYKEGSMSIGLDGGNIKVALSLSGETGNRNFDIYLHDFLFK